MGLALQLVGVDTAAAEAFTRLGPGGALRRARLVEVADNEPWLARTLSAPELVAAALCGALPQDPVVARLRVTPRPVQQPGTAEIADAITNGRWLVWVRSAPAAAGLSLAASAFVELGVAFTSIDLHLCLSTVPLSAVVASATLEAALSGRGLVIVGAESLVEPLDRAVVEELARAAVPVIAVSTSPWNVDWLQDSPYVIDAQPLTVTARTALWHEELGEVTERDAALHEVLMGLRFTPEALVAVVDEARLLTASGTGPISADVVREAARRVSSAKGSMTNTMRVDFSDTLRLSFDDLVLPSDADASMRKLVLWVRHRDQVAARGLLRRRGITALFAGHPGTGKTLAARVVADELSIDLLRVDLSTIVDKYIGETEKNLERVFQAAESRDVVLFFDEADALFGSRSEVRDARDRYANQEVSYLLQRIESFDGLTILATNLRGNLDRAFSRRMSFIINFPDPDTATRRRLWAQHLAQLSQWDDADPISLDFLADSAELSGGDIRNIVLAAAYDAVSAGERVGMRHLAAAMASEYLKLGRMILEHEFRRAAYSPSASVQLDRNDS